MERSNCNDLDVLLISYLGFTGKGIAQIIVTIVTCGIGSLWGFVEGILILTGSINTDAQGIPLKD